VGVQKVNILTVQLDEPLDEAGFRHVATAVGERLGAQRIGASDYEAEPGTPIWPYHYHHGIEEWLYVIAGAPVLRDPTGERTLSPGDVVCFPSGAVGAHTVMGPGRFVIFATGQFVEPWLSVYPDSDKVSGPEGILLRSRAVGYWHGEGTAGPAEASSRPAAPAVGAPRPVVNVLDEEVGGLGAGRLEGSVVDLEPGAASSEPYQYVHGREKWLLVLAGVLTLRHPEGHDELQAGDLVCFAEGPRGAHQILNRGDAAARALVLSTTGWPANVCFPDTGDWLMRNGPGEENVQRS
jgi:uncharacterized cupin superfamily protein